MIGDYMVNVNACNPIIDGQLWVGQTNCWPNTNLYLCSVCNCFHSYGCCPGVYPQVVQYPVPYPVPTPIAPLVNPSAATLVAHAKARLIEVERRLAEAKELEAERAQLQRIIAAGA